MRAFVFICCLAALVCAAPNEPQNAAWNVNLNTSSDPAFFFGGWSGHSYFPSPDDWRKHPVYQFVTDRFADGNPLVSYSFPIILRMVCQAVGPSTSGADPARCVAVVEQ